MQVELKVLDHGHVKLQNIAGQTRRLDRAYDADDVDPARAARFSYNASDKDRTREDDLKLASYLLENKHTTPFEMIEVWFEMKLPIFVARQFVRHRTVSINEVSARYVQLPNEFYIPKVENIGVKSAINKQGRVVGRDAICSEAESYCRLLREHCNRAYRFYDDSLDHGIPAEIARCALPVNIYTKWLWKQDLHNLMHFLRLRRHQHAQFEAREYADAIHTLLSSVLPETMALFDRLNQ